MVMKKYLSYIFVVFALILVIVLAFYIFGSTTFTLSGTDANDGQLSAETEFPKARCRKIIQFKFPPVKLECEEKDTRQ
jgi:hypothetical protein